MTCSWQHWYYSSIMYLLLSELKWQSFVVNEQGWQMVVLRCTYVIDVDWGPQFSYFLSRPLFGETSFSCRCRRVVIIFSSTHTFQVRRSIYGHQSPRQIARQKVVSGWWVRRQGNTQGDLRPLQRHEDEHHSLGGRRRSRGRFRIAYVRHQF